MTAEASMPATIVCPNLKCRKILSVPDELRGKSVKCQHCQTVLRVPDPTPPTPPTKPVYTRR
jgi:LSD1 subclass zinc finger protein